jgi:chemotaxis protein MotA
MFSSIAQNLLGYDLLIILLAIFNGFFVISRLRKTSNQLKRQLQGTIYLPIEMLLEKVQKGKRQSLSLHGLQELREKEVFYYHVFDTINSVFPLMGILGTVIGLLRMIGLESQTIMDNFTVALTSTFWGLVFAIIYKAVDGVIAPKFAQNGENIELIFERLDMALGEGYVHEEVHPKKQNR